MKVWVKLALAFVLGIGTIRTGYDLYAAIRCTPSFVTRCPDGGAIVAGVLIAALFGTAAISLAVSGLAPMFGRTGMEVLRGFTASFKGLDRWAPIDQRYYLHKCGCMGCIRTAKDVGRTQSDRRCTECGHYLIYERRDETGPSPADTQPAPQPRESL